MIDEQKINDIIDKYVEIYKRVIDLNKDNIQFTIEFESRIYALENMRKEMLNVR
jgi:hypothetical protein